jgi:hypothetical protein
MFQWQSLAKAGGNNLKANIWSGTKSMESEKTGAITKLMSMVLFASGGRIQAPTHIRHQKHRGRWI